MSERFDVLIVGAGLFGATCAHELTRRQLRCLVLEKREHIAGNCYTDSRDSIDVHVYGPHIFHTSDRSIWDWVNQFTQFNDYRHRIKVNHGGTLYSFPINLHTLRQLWGVTTTDEARAALDRARLGYRRTNDVEGWALSQLGRELYEIFIEGYSRKQWGKDPRELPASIVKRLPIRLTSDDSYFDDRYQGIPEAGYTAIFERLLNRCPVRLNTDYFDDRAYFDGLARRIVYTGPLDRFFDYGFGRLLYRGVRLDHERLEVRDFQGIAIVNYPEERVPFTRIVEHKHFTGRDDRPVTWITREYPTSACAELEPMYPVRDVENCRILERYQLLARSARYANVYFGGRLAEYLYYDMHQVIASALKAADRIATSLAEEGIRPRSA